MNGGLSQRARVLADATRDNRLHKLAKRSFSDIHHSLGKLIETVPGKAQRNDGSGKYTDTDKRHFDGLSLAVAVQATPTVDAVIDAARDADPDFDARCQADWDAIDVPALLAAQKAKRRPLS